MSHLFIYILYFIATVSIWEISRQHFFLKNCSCLLGAYFHACPFQQFLRVKSTTFQNTMH